jgi:hypothetical protein
LSDDDKRHYPKYKGKHVTWLGYDDKRVRKVDPRYVTARPDNIFDPEKLKAVAQYVRSNEDVEMFTAVAEGRTIDLDYISETLRAESAGDLNRDYAMDEPFTTGDSEVDDFLQDEEAWFEENTYVTVEDIRPYITGGEDLLRKDFEAGKVDDEDLEFIKEALDLYMELKQSIDEAVEQKTGDIGKKWYVLRDGNHRGLGAIAGGEPYIYITLTKNSYNETPNI